MPEGEEEIDACLPDYFSFRLFLLLTMPVTESGNWSTLWAGNEIRHSREGTGELPVIGVPFQIVMIFFKGGSNVDF